MKFFNMGKKIVSGTKSLFQPRLAKKHANPYATHLPVLIGVARLLKIKRVLELGSGDYSTPIFLNKACFPDLEKLTSLEDDSAWAYRLRERMEPDTRFQLVEVNAPISSVIKDIDLQEFDMIFVDNSPVEMERANTLIQISARNLPETVVMIHDYERVSYQRATKLFTKRFSFFAFNPAVGMVWKGRSVNKFALRMLDFTLHRYSSRAAPDNVLQWKEYFDKTLFL